MKTVKNNMRKAPAMRIDPVMKGSLTVEASLLIPFLFFILAALVLMIISCRSSLLLESNVMMESEAEVMAEKEMSASELLLGRWSAVSEGSDTTYALIPGIRQLTGGDLICSCSVTSIRINYVNDWYKSGFLKRKSYE